MILMVGEQGRMLRKWDILDRWLIIRSVEIDVLRDTRKVWAKTLLEDYLFRRQ